MSIGSLQSLILKLKSPAALPTS